MDVLDNEEEEIKPPQSAPVIPYKPETKFNKREQHPIETYQSSPKEQNVYTMQN